MNITFWTGASETVIDNIRTLKRARRLTNHDVAQKMSANGFDMPTSSVAFLFAGRRRHVWVDELVALATVFGVTLTDLIGELCPICASSPPAGMVCAQCGHEGASSPDELAAA